MLRLVPSPVSPARGPPTDWGELVQVYHDRDIFQASSDEMPAIDIHSLWPLPEAGSRKSREAAGLGETPRPRRKNATPGGKGRRTGQGLVNL